MSFYVWRTRFSIDYNGAVENPAKKCPSVFGSVEIFVKYPYLLPCMVASSVTLTGTRLVYKPYTNTDCVTSRIIPFSVPRT